MVDLQPEPFQQGVGLCRGNAGSFWPLSEQLADLDPGPAKQYGSFTKPKPLSSLSSTSWPFLSDVGDDLDLTCTGTAKMSERSSRSSADLDLPALAATMLQEGGRPPGVLSGLWVALSPQFAPPSGCLGD